MLLGHAVPVDGGDGRGVRVPPAHGNQLSTQTPAAGPFGGKGRHPYPHGNVSSEVREGAGKDGVLHTVYEERVLAHCGRGGHDGLGKRRNGGPVQGGGVHHLHCGQIGTTPPSHHHQDATPTSRGRLQTAGGHAGEVLHPLVVHVAAECAGLLVPPVLPPYPCQESVHHHQGEVLVRVLGHGAPGVCAAVIDMYIFGPSGGEVAEVAIGCARTLPHPYWGRFARGDREGTDAGA